MEILVCRPQEKPRDENNKRGERHGIKAERLRDVEMREGNQTARAPATGAGDAGDDAHPADGQGQMPLRGEVNPRDEEDDDGKH
jgi:hypothetical protein